MSNQRRDLCVYEIFILAISQKYLITEWILRHIIRLELFPVGASQGMGVGGVCFFPPEVPHMGTYIPPRPTQYSTSLPLTPVVLLDTTAAHGERLHITGGRCMGVTRL